MTAGAQRGVRIAQAATAAEIAIARELFVEYQQSLGVDLSFQDFDGELAALPGAYVPPHGCLLLASAREAPVACVALRPHGEPQARRAEMKRLYVRPFARGLGLGPALVARVLEFARSAGYAEVVLDTLPTMREAQRLYERFGFEDIAPYRPNPIAGSRYMGKFLAPPRA